MIKRRCYEIVRKVIYCHLPYSLTYSQVVSTWITASGEVWSHNTISTSPHLLRCMYQARKVRGHVLCVSGIEFPSFYVFAMHFGLIPTAWYSLFFILWSTLYKFGNSGIRIPRMSLMDQSRFLLGFVVFSLYFFV